mmetsp:Transcript_25683/g.82950  ORF Transcript_25683/g.82950 Transcript_25683/m.82950 type:complete len:257 (+) Transcript_25683:834-1604(+)
MKLWPSLRHGLRSVPSGAVCNQCTASSKVSSSSASSETVSAAPKLSSQASRGPSTPRPSASHPAPTLRSSGARKSSNSSTSCLAPSNPRWAGVSRSNFFSSLFAYFGCSSTGGWSSTSASWSRWADTACSASASSRSSWSPSASCTTWKSAPSPASSSAGSQRVIFPVEGPTPSKMRSTLHPTYGCPESIQPSSLLVTSSSAMSAEMIGSSSRSRRLNSASEAWEPWQPRWGVGGKAEGEEPSREPSTSRTCAAVS